MRAIADIVAAVRLLTLVALPGADGNRPARYFPTVGWMFAAVALGVAWGAMALDRAAGAGAMLAGAVTVALWAGLSGMLHLDGLADVADGLGVRGSRDERLAIMRESGIGAFGVSAIVLVVALQIAALASIIETRSWWALAAAPVLGRMSAFVGTATVQPARPDGLGAQYAHPETVAGWVIALVPVAALLGLAPSWAGAAATLACLGIACALPALIARPTAGMTGDTLGASVMVTETLVLLLGAVLGGAL